MFADLRWAVFATLLLAGLQQSPAPPRDPRPGPPTGTAAIGGRVVTTDSTPAPVRRARVVLTQSETGFGRSVMTDDDGRFLATALPAGRYTVSATKPGSLRASYGAARPGRPGTSIVLAAAQRVTDLELTMARGGVITGIVTEGGRPVPGVTARLLQFRYESGERVLAPAGAGSGSPTEITDDRGEYRFFGLAPGEYVVGIVPDDPAAGFSRLMSGGTAGYAPVYYPGTTMATDAAVVTVAAGEETSGVNLSVQRVRTARIEGTIVAPEHLTSQDFRLTIVPEASSPLSSTSASNLTVFRRIGIVLPDRRFAFGGVTPGRYTIVARAIQRAAAGTTEQYVSVITGITSMYATAEVVVDGTDIAGIALDMRPGVTVSGRVQLEFPTGTTPAPDISKVRVWLRPAPPFDSNIALGWPTASANAAGEFTLMGVIPGTYWFSASYGGDLANGWSAKTATLNERELLDGTLHVTADEPISSLAVTVTRATQRITGVLQDATGKAAPGLTVVLFPADRALWRVGRRIRTARSGQDGRYTINTIPAGEYRLAAVTDLEPSGPSDPSFLESLLATSIAITIRDGERKVHNVRVGR